MLIIRTKVMSYVSSEVTHEAREFEKYYYYGHITYNTTLLFGAIRHLIVYNYPGSLDYGLFNKIISILQINDTKKSEINS